MALDGVSAITLPEESTEENTCGLDGTDSVPVCRVKVLLKTNVSVTISLSTGHYLLGIQFPVSLKPIRGHL